jgi:hypothetical protein
MQKIQRRSVTSSTSSCRPWTFQLAVFICPPFIRTPIRLVDAGISQACHLLGHSNSRSTRDSAQLLRPNAITVRLYCILQPDVFVVCPCTRVYSPRRCRESRIPSVLRHFFLSPIRSARMIDSIQSQVIGILGIMIVDKSVIVSDESISVASYRSLPLH